MTFHGPAVAPPDCPARDIDFWVRFRHPSGAPEYKIHGFWDGDRHSEGDTIEAPTGAFLGGGYGTTGWKTGNKLGHYFWGRFSPEEHTAADNLRFLRQTIDRHITFWEMAPDLSIFSNLATGYRGLAWPGQEYVLGTNRARRGTVAELPPGEWSVQRHDIVAMESAILSQAASGRFVFDAPASRAVLLHFRKKADARLR